MVRPGLIAETTMEDPEVAHGKRSLAKAREITTHIPASPGSSGGTKQVGTRHYLILMLSGGAVQQTHTSFANKNLLSNSPVLTSELQDWASRRSAAIIESQTSQT